MSQVCDSVGIVTSRSSRFVPSHDTHSKPDGKGIVPVTG